MSKASEAPEVANMVKRRATRYVISDERCNEMREKRDKNRQNEINKPWSHPRAMKKEHRSQITKKQILKTKTSRDTIDGKPATGKQHH
ncbi:hypothetical protein F2Q69_00020144 [Brassica cretica]|uniref:IBB domain-containing protein n=1 Tax=Brassica cretica TaxID=69181 RepID=A0A8S9Q7G8_BRACR|nr:hypothetical protein F2Q69_00020144 [Brassica cretica]